MSTNNEWSFRAGISYTNNNKCTCAECIQLAAKETIINNAHEVPNSYEAPIAAMRAANATPATAFEARFKAMRQREFALQRAEIDAHISATPQPRMTAAEGAEFEAPNSYDAAIKALQARDARAREAKERQ